MKKSLDEHINRMKYLTTYNGKKRINEDLQPAPAAQPATQPAQGQQQPQQNQAQIEANLEREMDAAMNQIIQQLPSELKQIDANHDGQIDVNDGAQQQSQQSQVQQPQQPVGTQPAAQRVAEATALREEIQTQLKQLDEIVATAAGVVAAIPSMANLVGKAASFLGKKIGSGDLNQWGQKAQAWGHKVHHKYINFIGKLTAPFTKNLTPEKRDKVNNMVFYAIIAGLFAASIGGAVHAAQAGHTALAAGETGLSAIKASELVPAVQEIIPQVLAAVKVA